MFSFATLYDAMPAQQGDGAEATSPSAPSACPASPAASVGAETPQSAGAPS